MDRIRKVLAILGNYGSSDNCNSAHLGDGALLALRQAAPKMTLGKSIKREVCWKELVLNSNQIGTLNTLFGKALSRFWMLEDTSRSVAFKPATRGKYHTPYAIFTGREYQSIDEKSARADILN